jgi:hypothetical protein
LVFTSAGSEDEPPEPHIDAQRMEVRRLWAQYCDVPSARLEPGELIAHKNPAGSLSDRGVMFVRDLDLNDPTDLEMMRDCTRRNALNKVDCVIAIHGRGELRFVAADRREFRRLTAEELAAVDASAAAGSATTETEHDA